MIDKKDLPKVVQTLINSYVTLIKGNARTIDNVPEIYIIGKVEYRIKDYVLLEI